MAHVILVRHGMSLWNKQGLWTGLRDIPLAKDGILEAQKVADKLKDIPIDIAFTSKLLRATQTLQEIVQKLHLDISIIEDAALNERNYGDFTGKNKWDIKKEIGEEEFLKIRRGWDYPIKNGETLKDVYNRVTPYYQNTVEPKLRDGKNVLIVAHGNSLRALIKYLEHISDKDIPQVEMETGQVYIYQISSINAVISKQIR